MDKRNTEKKIEQLSKELQEHNYNYYVLSMPTISDFDFDQKLKELEKLESEFPELKLPDSPTLRVGGEPTKDFKTVSHKYPMLSLSNSYSEDEIRDFDQSRAPLPLGTQEPKHLKSKARHKPRFKSYLW